MEYLDFELEVTAADGGGYAVRVLRSPAGEASGTLQLPFDDLVLQNRLQALQIALLRSGTTRRRVQTAESRTVQVFGQELWDALFEGDVRARFEASRSEARRQDAGMRIKLRFEDAKLAALPWEYLFDADRGDFVTLSASTPLVRYIPLPQVMAPLLVRLPLRILGMIASPSDLPALDVDRERQRLDSALAGLVSRGLVELVWMTGSTTRDLQQMLWRGPWHVFHFVGHGGFDEMRGEGLVVMTTERGASQSVSATDLGRLLGDHDPLRLAVLNACESARGDSTDVFASTAATLVRRGTPAVVAMQYEITDDAAIEFSRSFYEAIAHGIAVDASLAEARKGVALAIPGTLEWGTPVLYMRAPDGVLFDIPAQAVAPAGEEPAGPEEDLPEPAEVDEQEPVVIAAEPEPSPAPERDAPLVPTPVDTTESEPGTPTPVPATEASAAEAQVAPRGIAAAAPPAAAAPAVAPPAAAPAVAPPAPTPPAPAPATALPAAAAPPSGTATAPAPTQGTIPGWTDPARRPAASRSGNRTVIVIVVVLLIVLALVAALTSALEEGLAGVGSDPGGSQALAGGPDGTSALSVLPAAGSLGTIVFANDGGESSDLFAVDPTGGTPVRLTTDPADDRWPSWSPDRTRLAFSRVTDGKGDLWLLAADGSEVQVTAGDANDWAPAWTPDGQALLFSSDRNEEERDTNDVWIVSLDGSEPRFLVGEPGRDDATPAWSPGGDWIAFASDRDGDARSLYLYAVGDGSIQRMTFSGWVDADPSWSQDGQSLIFARASDTNTSDRDVWSMRLDDATPVQLTTDEADEGDPVIGPDGLSIAFDRRLGGAYQILVDGQVGARNLTSILDGDSTDPSWR